MSWCQWYVIINHHHESLFLNLTNKILLQFNMPLARERLHSTERILADPKLFGGISCVSEVSRNRLSTLAPGYFICDFPTVASLWLFCPSVTTRSCHVTPLSHFQFFLRIICKKFWLCLVFFGSIGCSSCPTVLHLKLLFLNRFGGFLFSFPFSLLGLIPGTHAIRLYDLNFLHNMLEFSFQICFNPQNCFREIAVLLSTSLLHISHPVIRSMGFLVSLSLFLVLFQW